MAGVYFWIQHSLVEALDAAEHRELTLRKVTTQLRVSVDILDNPPSIN